MQGTSQLFDKVSSDSPVAAAVNSMKKYDPDFDFEELQDEAMEIFQEFYCNFLTGNKEYLDMVCGGTAGAICKAHIDLRDKEGWRFKYEEVLCASNCFFQGGMLENRVPQFSFTIEVQEFDEKLCRKSGGKFVPSEKCQTPACTGAIMNN